MDGALVLLQYKLEYVIVYMIELEYNNVLMCVWGLCYWCTSLLYGMTMHSYVLTVT